MRALSNLANQLQNNEARIQSVLEFNPNNLSQEELKKLQASLDLLSKAIPSIQQAANHIGHTQV